MGELKGLADIGRRGRRATAEVNPIALTVERNGFPFRQIVNQLDLKSLALIGEERAGSIAADFLALESIATRDNLAHFGLDTEQVVGREYSVLAIKIVVKAGQSAGLLRPGCPGKAPARPRRAHARSRALDS